MFRSTASKVALIVVFALVLGYYDLPSSYQLDATPNAVKDAKVHLGLDLQGGSQLDYKIDLRKVPEKDRKAIVEGVKTVINRRVNALGVSEPNIYTSTIGDEQHLIVELAGIKDLNEAKKVVGKTIQLEFKEKREKEDPNYKENIRKLGASILDRILSGKATMEVIGQEETQASPEKVRYSEAVWQLRSEVIDEKMASAIFDRGIEGKVIPTLLEGNDGYTYKDDQLVPLDGYFIVKLTGKRDASALDAKEKSLDVSHILIAYRGAERAPDTVLRSKDEAKQLAEELLGKLQAGASFAKTAQDSSDEPDAKKTSGSLAANGPVKVGGSYVQPFTDAALKLTKVGQLSGVTETPFGFHIIRADDFSQVKYEKIFFSTQPDPWQSTSLSGAQFQRADVTFDQLLKPTVSIQFNPEGAKLFEELTARNVNKPLAIFVGGNLISAPNVNERIAGGNAVITGRFTVEEAQALARDLNTGAIPAPVLLSGQYTIGASLGEEALNKSVKAGIIGFILLAAFMIFYYRLPGVIAVLALSLYTTIMFFLIKSELPLAISLSVAILVFIGILYKVLRSKEDGWEKFVTFILACFVLFFVTFLLSNAVVLTLAGIAGVVLSIGMAVDANILIFERTKEELRAGRPINNAIDVGFDRAWSSIRDSNFSSLITCGILFYFGTSIIQGFAFNLAAGILVSMFTAITITKTLLGAVMRTRLGEKPWLWGMASGGHKNYNIIGNTKVWFTFSGIVVGISLVALVVFGLKLGLDFKGGTLMDLTFKKEVTVEQIKSELKNIQEVLNVRTTESASSSASGASLESAVAKVNFENGRVVPAGEGEAEIGKRYILNLEHVDNDTHEKVLASLKNKFGNLTENRFTTIGPTVGATLQKRAVMAVIIAMVMIVLYVAFAFRKVPKRVSAWKFGVCAIVALMHDVLIPIGVFAIFRFEVDALFITAMLTVLGFSVHDTIVVFDRIRENLRYQDRDESFAHVANKSTSQTMARSINTSLTVFIVLLALLLFGSSSIFHFVLVLIIGIVVGTYSSIFIASPLLVLWQKKSQQ
ncbi:MAG: protein translocase subunit SecF [Patescibacteria group bacterium]